MTRRGKTEPTLLPHWGSFIFSFDQQTINICWESESSQVGLVHQQGVLTGLSRYPCFAFIVLASTTYIQARFFQGQIRSDSQETWTDGQLHSLLCLEVRVDSRWQLFACQPNTQSGGRAACMFGLVLSKRTSWQQCFEVSMR